jgi:hypothetical protein
LTGYIGKKFSLSNIISSTTVHYMYMILSTGKCSGDTYPVYYPSFNCVNCPITCLTCQGVLCAACNITLNFYFSLIALNPISGICLCLPGYFIKNNLCFRCD